MEPLIIERSFRPQGRPLRALQGEEYELIQQDQNLVATLEYIPKERQQALLIFEGETITGAIVKITEGEYKEIWLTTEPAYYALTSFYFRVI